MNIKDWPDLIRPGVTVVTPNPKSSGNGKLSFLAAWGSVVQRGGGEEAARHFVTSLYQHTPVLDGGARGAATTFAIEKVGDVHLTWENEALREVVDSKGELEIIYPPISIKAEPAVAWVDANVSRHGSEESAKAYLKFLFSGDAQHLIAQYGYRPSRPGSPQKAFQHPASDRAVPDHGHRQRLGGRAAKVLRRQRRLRCDLRSQTEMMQLERKPMAWNYSLKTARADLLAGLTVAAISLPQAMAYALIAGIDPRFGLYSAIVVTFVAAVFGSSNHLINGPTNAISLVVFSALAFIDPEARFDAYQATFLLAVMIGVTQIVIAVFRLGDLTRYISESVVIGFMTGAGFLVALSQVGNFLGIKDRGTGHQHVLVRFWNTLTEGGPVNPYALVIGAGTIVLVVLLRHVARKYRLPQMEMLLALIAVTGVAASFGWTIPGADSKTTVSVIGAVPASLPAPHIPEIKLWWVQEMSSSALAIAFLGLLEALAIAKSIASNTRQPLDYNRQCLAEGLANLAGGFFQCLPGSGSLTRSAINFQAGAVTRFSGVFAAAAVALVVVLFAPLARYIPKAALAGLLVLTAYRLVDWKRLGYAVRASRYDAGARGGHSLRRGLHQRRILDPLASTFR